MTRYKKRIITLSLVFLSVVGSLIIYITYENFFPKRSYDISGSSRLFAQAIDSSDETIHVMSADWPHTFSKPFFLGDAEWRDRYSAAQFYWSKDGSVVVFFAKGQGAKESSYVSAYDYKNHQQIRGELIEEHGSSCHTEINDLLKQRGGRETNPIEMAA